MATKLVTVHRVVTNLQDSKERKRVSNMKFRSLEVRETRRSQRPPMEAILLFASALEQDETGDADAAVKTLEQLIEEYPDYTDPVAERSRIMGS